MHTDINLLYSGAITTEIYILHQRNQLEHMTAVTQNACSAQK